MNTDHSQHEQQHQAIVLFSAHQLTVIHQIVQEEVAKALKAQALPHQVSHIAQPSKEAK